MLCYEKREGSDDEGGMSTKEEREWMQNYMKNCYHTLKQNLIIHAIITP